MQADKRRREVEFAMGDKVYLKIQTYRLKSQATRINQKLKPRFYGPFAVLEKIGVVAYKLQCQPNSMVHPIFHVSLLKKCTTPNVISHPLPPRRADDKELKVKPSKVLPVRTDA